MSDAERHQKLWYDRNARTREFANGDQVLVLLPSSTSKLLAQWQRPYTITSRIGTVNYEVDMNDKRKRKRIFHINMLKRWHVPSNSVFFAQDQADSDQNDEVQVRNDSEGNSDDQPLIGDQLTTEQQHELKLLLGK